MTIGKGESKTGQKEGIFLGQSQRLSWFQRIQTKKTGKREKEEMKKEGCLKGTVEFTRGPQETGGGKKYDRLLEFSQKQKITKTRLCGERGGVT